MKGRGDVDDALARTGDAGGQRCALPTAVTFTHIPTARYNLDELTQEARVGQIYFGDHAGKWVRFESALTAGPFVLIPVMCLVARYGLQNDARCRRRSLRAMKRSTCEAGDHWNVVFQIECVEQRRLGSHHGPPLRVGRGENLRDQGKFFNQIGRKQL